MPDKKLTDAEIVKALEELQNMTELTPPICNYEKDLTNPPYCKPFEQFQYNVRIALDLFNRYEAKLEEAEDTIQYADKEIRKLNEEINRLQAENEDYKALYEGLKAEHIETIKAIKHYKAEAYKECIEKVKEKQYLDGVYVVDVKDIDNLLKELVGDNKCQE